MIIGLFCGVLAYRTSYAAILNFRFNHIPLPPFALHQRFSYNLSEMHDGLDELLETNAEFANRLVMVDWWGRAVENLVVNDRKWLRLVTDMKRIWAEKMQERKDMMESTVSCPSSHTQGCSCPTSIHSVPDVAHPTIDCGRSRSKSAPAILC